MTDRPILFSAPMIRALIAGRKTQTRRVIRRAPNDGWWIYHDGERCGWSNGGGGMVPDTSQTPYQQGDRLWVREQCATWGVGPGPEPVSYPVAYAADDKEWNQIKRDAKAAKDEWKIRPSIHMPRWASRLTLIVTDVRVQRLHDLSEKDALAEGITAQSMIIGSHCASGVHTEVHAERFFNGTESDDHDGYEDGIDAYAALWNRLNGDGAWDANPWVVAVSFGVLLGNIDEVRS